MAFFRKKTSKIDKIERETTINAVEIRNLVVEYHTSKATVKAVNGIDLTLKKNIHLVWLARPVQERPQPCWH